MKILFLLSDISFGGAERVAIALCESWAESGHEVHLLATYSGGGEIAYPISKTITVSRLNSTLQERPWWRKSWPSRVNAIARKLNTGEFDIAVSFLSNVNVAAILAGLLSKVPVVVSERVYPPAVPLNFPWEHLRRMTYPLAQRVVMQTDDGMDWLKHEHPRSNGAVIPNPLVIPMPVSIPVIEPDSFVHPKQKMLLAVGRLTAQKGFINLIDAFSAIHELRPTWDLTIIGEGPQRAELQARIDHHGLEDRVRLIGRVGNPGDWYKRADRFALTSTFEGFPNALAEALAHGVPSLALDCMTGPRELVQAGDNGMLLPVDADMEQLRQGILKLLDNPFPEAAEAAKVLRQRLALQSVAPLWIDLFEQVLRGRHHA